MVPVTIVKLTCDVSNTVCLLFARPNKRGVWRRGVVCYPQGGVVGAGVARDIFQFTNQTLNAGAAEHNPKPPPTMALDDRRARCDGVTLALHRQQ
jgi:hypothetical protein